MRSLLVATMLGGSCPRGDRLVFRSRMALEEKSTDSWPLDVIPAAGAVLPGGIEVEQAVGELLARLLNVGQHALLPVTGIGLQVRAGQALRQHVEP